MKNLICLLAVLVGERALAMTIDPWFEVGESYKSCYTFTFRGSGRNDGFVGSVNCEGAWMFSQFIPQPPSQAATFLKNVNSRLESFGFQEMSCNENETKDSSGQVSWASRCEFVRN